MANLVSKRVSTDQQSTDPQNLVLAEAGIEEPVVLEEEPGTSSRLHPLQRPKFGELRTYARPGGTVHVSEMFRLVRGTGHILSECRVLDGSQAVLRYLAVQGHGRRQSAVLDSRGYRPVSGGGGSTDVSRRRR
ncbi:recombinase family protein [Streptomyces sp. NPDC056682]|uniref:recombinase family protein n=1 Tax=Streptomyces sp. NPDC056682 TaxID=3345909 RepID=UPI0036803FED